MAKVKKQKTDKLMKTSKKGQSESKVASEPVVSGQLQKKIEKKLQKPQKDPKGVVFIKHLPHGFFEEQLKKYFEQFGHVTRVRLARSNRTGRSKGYAFVEFEYPEVAEVAAETMDNYLMFKKIIKAAYIPPEKQQFNYFRSSLKQIKNKSGKIVWVSRKTADIQKKVKKHNDWTEKNFQKRTARQLRKLNKLSNKYAHLGIDIDKIIMKPNVSKESKEDIQKEHVLKEAAAGSSKVLKRKISSKNAFPNKQKTINISKKEISLEDLLGNTLSEDSDDEDYIADSDEETSLFEEPSDEETFDFKKKSDDVEEDNEEKPDSEGNDNESGEDENAVNRLVKNPLKKAKTFGKSLKSNVERFDKILKRKPHTGGVQKIAKNSSKQSKLIMARGKGALQLAAAKELAKPLPKGKIKKVNAPKSKLLKKKK